MIYSSTCFVSLSIVKEYLLFCTQFKLKISYVIHTAGQSGQSGSGKFQNLIALKQFGKCFQFAVPISSITRELMPTSTIFARKIFAMLIMF